MSKPNTIGETWRERQERLCEPLPNYDPAPAVNVPIAPTRWDAAATGRLADRPPDAALSPVDVAFLGQEDRIRALVDERDGLRRHRNQLHRDLEQERERTGVREVTLLVALRASRRTIQLLILIGGSVLAWETIALAGLVWGMR